MPTLNELKLRGTYDGSQIDAGVKKTRQEMKDAARDIKQAADSAEAAVKSSMTKAGQAYAKLPAEARKALDDAHQAHLQYQQRTNSVMMGIGASMSVALTAPLLLAANQAKNLASDFEQNMDVLQVSIRATSKEMEALRQKARDLGADMTLPATSATDASRAMNELAKGGLNVAAVMTAARGTMQLAAAAGIDSAQAAKIQARALAAFSLEGTQATHVADLLARAAYSATGTIEDMGYALQAAAAVSAKSGQSIDATVTAITQLAKAGITGQDAGTSLKTMLLRLEEGGSIKKVRDVMESLGVQVYDAAGRMKDMRSIIEEFTPAMRNLTEEQRNAALATIFGSDAIRAAQVILGGGVKAYDEMRTSLDQQGAAAELAAARNKGLKGALDGLSSAWETLLQSTAEPVLVPLANLTRTAGELVGNFGEMSGAGKAAAGGILLITAAAGPAILGAASLKNALITLGMVRAASTTAAAAEAGANAAVAASAGAAAVAEVELAAAERGAAVAGTQAAAAQTALAAAQTGVAASGGGAAAGLGLAGRAMALLASPAGIAVLAITALTAAFIGLKQWSELEAEQAKENARQFIAMHESAQKVAKANVETANSVKPLLVEFLKLEKQTVLTADEQKRHRDLSNEISQKMPGLVKAYDNQANAILDVARAHKEAATQAANHYDKELALSNGRMQIIKATGFAQDASDLREKTGVGKGVSFSQIRASMGAEKIGGNYFAKMSPYITADGPFSLALGAAKNAEANGSSPERVAQLWERAEKMFGEAQAAYRKILADQAEATRNAKNLRDQSKMSPQEWQAKQDAEAKKAAEAERQRTTAENKKFQAEYDRQLKERGYQGSTNLMEGGAGSKGSAKAAAQKAGSEITAQTLVGAAKYITTPEGQASCGYFANALLKKTGAMFDSKGYMGGAQDLIQRVKAGGGRSIKASEARAGDLVYYYGPGYGSKANRDAKGNGYHVGVNRGDGFVVDSSDEVTRTKQSLGRNAQFIRPMRAATAGEMNIQQVVEYQQRQNDLEREWIQLETERAAAVERLQQRVDMAADSEGQYAEAMGLTLKQFKALTPEQRKRADAAMASLSSSAADEEIRRMRQGGFIRRFTDPVERGTAEYAAQLEGRKDISQADRVRMIEEKRAELADARAEAWKQELAAAQTELQIAQALTEEEKARLQLKASRPELSDEQRGQLLELMAAKRETARAADAQAQIRAATEGTAQAQLQVAHTEALQAIQKNTKLTEEERAKAIERQNALLEEQRRLLELNAAVASKKLTQGEADAIAAEIRKQTAAGETAKANEAQTAKLARAQEDANRRQEEAQNEMLQKARDNTDRAADILLRPFQDGLQNGMRGFWQSLTDQWRQTTRQMFLEWTRSQLVRALEPKLDGADVRRSKAATAAKTAADLAASAAMLSPSSIRQGESGGIPDWLGGALGGYKAKGALQAANSVLGALPNFNWFGLKFAAGGILPDVGRPVLVGEHGPELITPNGSGRVHNAEDTRKMLGGSTSITLVQNITTPDPHGLRRASGQVTSDMLAALARNQRRNFRK